MIICVRPIAAGKTYWAVQRVLENPRLILLTHSRDAANDIRERYPGMMYRVFSWMEYREGSCHGMMRGRHELIIDNADLILNQIVNDPIFAITLTNKEHELCPIPFHLLPKVNWVDPSKPLKKKKLVSRGTKARRGASVKKGSPTALKKGTKPRPNAKK